MSPSATLVGSHFQFDCGRLFLRNSRDQTIYFTSACNGTCEVRKCGKCCTRLPWGVDHKLGFFIPFHYLIDSLCQCLGRNHFRAPRLGTHRCFRILALLPRFALPCQSDYWLTRHRWLYPLARYYFHLSVCLSVRHAVFKLCLKFSISFDNSSLVYSVHITFN